MPSLDEHLREGLAARIDAGLYRNRRVLEGPQGPRLQVEGREYLAFCSNDYLGLAADPRVAEALRAASRRYGTGSGAAHLICGHTRAHHALEEELADFLGRPRALLFSTGYMANLGAVGALAGPGDLVLEDRLNHASLLDAGLLSRARLQRFSHADPEAAATRLAASGAAVKLLVTDGMFSMDGDLAPLEGLAAAAGAHGAWLMVDDAHGIGVLGTSGRGTQEAAGINPDRVPILVGTLGKALGTFGAFVAGSEALVETLIQHARSYVYTTALPPAIAEASRTSLRLVRDEPWRREHLGTLVARFRREARALGLPLMAAEGPIQPLLIGDTVRASALADALRQRGILAGAIRPPTVPDGTARLRITFSAAHGESDVDRLLEALGELVGPAGADAGGERR